MGGRGRQDEHREARNRVLAELGRLETARENDPQSAFREIAEATARVLDAGRVGVWLLSRRRDVARCVDVFDLAAGTHELGPQVAVALYPAYRDLIERTRTLICRDARTDPRTRVFAEEFFVPFGITSLINVPLRVGGQVRGVLSIAHVGEPRRWKPSETRFAAEMADLAALAIQVSERRDADRALHESEARFGIAFEYAPIGMTIVGTNRRAQRVNRALCRILGYSEAELLDLPLSEITHPDDMSLTMDHWKQIVAGDVDAYQIEKRYIHKQGHIIWARVSVALVRDEKNRPWYIITQLEDITERKLNEMRLAALLEVARDTSGVLDRQELIDRVQRRTARILPCDGVATFYRDERRPVFRLVHHLGIPEDIVFEPRALQIPMGAPLTEHLALGEPVIVSDPEDNRWLPAAFLHHFHVTALVATPLLVRGEPMGALVVFNTAARGPFGAEQIDLCAGIARQLGVAVEAIELYEHKREEAEISGALAWVGREMMGPMERARLLDRLVEATARVLNCELSHALLWKPEANAFVPVAGAGHGAEEWEMVRVVEIPARAFDDVLSRLERQSVVQLPGPGTDESRFVRMAGSVGITRVLCVGLRLRGEVIGLLTASYRGREEPFSETSERIAAGVAQLASLALENARLIEELDRADRLKSEFVATMSHELRTPLNVIVGYNDLMLEGAFGPLNEDQTATMHRIQASTDTLLELVNAVLQLSRMQSERLPLELGEVPVDDLIRRLDEETRPWREKANVQFSWDVAPGLPRLYTDSLKLRTVLRNLISNAVKFAEGGRVTTAVRIKERGVEFEVQDTGIGISPDVLPFIFDPFRQADGSITRRFGGVGLGLYIVDRLVDLLGGRISVDSEPGRGSRFRVWVPLHVRQLPVTAEPDSQADGPPGGAVSGELSGSA